MKSHFYFVLGLLVVGCKKDAPEAGLPPATQVGANTGGCLINGERFVATGWGSNNILSNAVPPLFGGFSFDSLYVIELNGQFKGQNTSVKLFFRSQKAGTYNLNKNTQPYPQRTALYALNHATYEASGAQSEVYVTSARYTGQVQLTYANVQQGLSAGTFEFTAASQADPSKTVSITSGRFDRKQ